MLGVGLTISGLIAWVNAFNAFAVNKKETFGSLFYFIDQLRLLPAPPAPTNHQEGNGNDWGSNSSNDLGMYCKACFFAALNNVSQ